MFISIIIIGVILLFFVIFTCYISKDGDFDDGIKLGATIAMLLCIEIVCINRDLQPTAMDVYQHKTTLEYKIVNDVKVDSTVVFKNDNVTISNIY